MRYTAPSTNSSSNSPAPGINPHEHLLDRERDLLSRLASWDAPYLAEELRPTGGADDRRTRVDDLRDLEQIWAQLAAAEGADYVGLRRGDSLDWDGLARLAIDASPDTALVSVCFTERATVMFVLRAGWPAPKVVRSHGRPGVAMTWAILSKRLRARWRG